MGEGGGINEALLTDLSKAFACLLHDLLIDKLAAYGFGYDSLVFIKKATSLKGNKEPQLTTLTALILTYYTVFHKVPYYAYSFPIFILMMFYDIDNCDIASYADDSTPYSSDFNLEEVI